MKLTPQYWNLAVACITLEATEEQKKSFTKMLRKNPVARQEFTNLQKEFDKYRPPHGNPETTDIPWSELKGRLEEDGLIETSQSGSLGSPRSLLRLAAVILLLLGIGLGTAYFLNDDQLFLKSGLRYRALTGITTIELSDGSLVTLNKGAEVRLDRSYPQKRKLILEGEAFFEVAPMAKSPFQISTGNSRILVKGTSFNVKNNPGIREVEVFVESGTVQLANEMNPNGIFLHPGEFGISTDHSVQLSNQENLNYLSWKTKEFRFINEDLEEILKILEQAYHAKIETGNNFPGDLKMTTAYSNMPLDSILQTITEAFDISYSRKGEKYIFEK